MDQRSEPLQEPSDELEARKVEAVERDDQRDANLSFNQSEEDHQEYPNTLKLSLITTALCLAILCFGLVRNRGDDANVSIGADSAKDNTILATAIPRITDHFHTLNDVGW